MNERHLNVLNALGVKIGDEIKVPGWFTYLVTNDGFVISRGNYSKKPSVKCFDAILERGFEIIK